MPILKQIDSEKKQSQPLVWVSRICLFESLDPLTPIRDPIEFTTGINIVWGIEDESNDEHFEPGHGVGKTTLCRLIRYCLGESSYGQDHAEKEIRHTFPDGYVAAEVHVGNATWAVLRPFDKHKADCARLGVSIDELIQDRPPKTSFDEYLGQISEACLSGFRTESVLAGETSIQWKHLLAMCTRDQEARYQSLWQWRSPRSDSGPPKIQKEDAFLTLRSVLGLLPDEETTLQRKLDSVETDLSKVERKIAERKREPEYWVRHHRRSLKNEFDFEDAEVASLDEDDMFGLPKLIEGRIAQLQSEQAVRLEELTSLDRKITLAATALQEPAELQEQEYATVEVTTTGTDVISESLEELRQLRQHIAEAKLSLCRYGQVSIGNCSYAQQQIVDLDQQIRDATETTLPTSAKRDQVAAALSERVKRRFEILQRLREELNKLNAQRRELDDQRRRASSEINNVRKAMDSLSSWEELRSGNQSDSELASLLSRKVGLESEEVSAKSKLAELLANQDQRLNGLRQVHEALVSNTLSKDFKGRVRLNRDGLEFRVFRGENLSREAFETLSILLADLTTLLMGAIGEAAHPGLLIHDSPREADLGGNIYRRLLLCVAQVADELGENGSTPFQYIVTTTTPPPIQLKKKKTMRLKLGGEEGMLFNQQLHVGSELTQQDLPLDEPASGEEATDE